LEIEQALDPSDENMQRIKTIELYFINQMKPVAFRIQNGTNIIIDNEKKFEKLCASLNEAGMHDARELSMYDFRIRMEYFEDKAASLNKTNNNADQ